MLMSCRTWECEESNNSGGNGEESKKCVLGGYVVRVFFGVVSLRSIYSIGFRRFMFFHLIYIFVLLEIVYDRFVFITS